MRRGFSLAEVLIGMLVLVGVFFALASIFPVSLASLRKSQHLVSAMHIGRETMELWEQKSWSDLVATTTPQSNIVQLDGEAYTVVVVVSDPQPPDPNVKQIDVQVLSQQGSDQAQARDSTMVFNYTDPL